MRALLRLLICVAFLAPDLAAQPWRVDSTKVSEAVQDSAGQVWGIAYYVNWGLFRWEVDSWKSVGVLGVPSAAGPFALVRGPDGAVYCVWNAGADTHAVTWHKGTSSKLLARFTGHLADRPRIFVDPSGNAWITEQGRHIFRVSPQGKAECVYTIANDQFVDDGRPTDNQSGFNAVFAAVDGRGRVWFWSDSLVGGTNWASLKGVLIFDGKNFEHYAHLAGVPDRKFSIVEPDDAEHMWLTVVGDQLYRVDINTLTATAAPGPDPESFHFVQRVFHAGQETYIVSGPAWTPVAERSGNGRSCALWRLRDGEWKRAVNGLDARPGLAQDPLRPFLATDQGLWLGAYGSGPWFVPNGEGERALIDWHYDYPLDGSEGLFQLADGRLLMISANEGSIAVKPAELLAAYQSPSGVQTLNPMRPFIQDARGHILGILSTGDNALSDWDGKTWTNHPLPGGFDPGHFWRFAEDSLERIWLLPDAFGKSVTIFDPRHETLEIHPGYSQALQAQLLHREDFRLDGDLSTQPSFTKKGQICYRDEWDRIRYFDGQKWLRWTSKEIDGSNEFVFDGPAFFDRAGNVAVNIRRKTWEFTEAGGWRPTSFEPGLGTDREKQALRSPPAPPGCGIGNPESVVRDRLGMYWLTYRGQLYRAIPGLCLPLFSPREHQPFIDSRKVTKVFIDLQGSAFLESYFYFNPPIGEYVIVKARQPLPKTELHATTDPSGVVKLRFDARTEGSIWFTWRIDGGSWSTPTHKREATVEWLPNGKHRIEAAAIDARLQIDPTPAEAQVAIQVDPRDQISTLIDKLNDRDYSVRDAAVAALLRQPVLALPLLRTAREKARPDQCWWIDAAIQQIEEDLSTRKNP